MYFRDMFGGFIPGGPPKDLGRRTKDLAHFAVGMAGFGAALAVSVAIVVVAEGPAAVINTLLDATKEGGRD